MDSPKDTTNGDSDSDEVAFAAAIATTPPSNSPRFHVFTDTPHAAASTVFSSPLLAPVKRCLEFESSSPPTINHPNRAINKEEDHQQIVVTRSETRHQEIESQGLLELASSADHESASSSYMNAPQETPAQVDRTTALGPRPVRLPGFLVLDGHQDFREERAARAGGWSLKLNNKRTAEDCNGNFPNKRRVSDEE